MTNGLNKWGRLDDDPNDQENPDPWANESSIGDVNGVKYPADLIRNFHQRSDVDSATYAQHHTIGLGKNQVSPGNHTHDGVNSKSIGGSWQPYNGTPSQMWGAVNVAPSLGNGFMTARYLKLGTLVIYKISVAFGSATTFGTGTWTFILPFPSVIPAGPTAQIAYLAGSANGTTNSGSYVSGTPITYNGNNQFVQIIDNDNRVLWQPTIPGWTTGGGFSMTITYESTS